MPQQPGTVAVSSDVSGESENNCDDELVFYPAYCYQASPTWFTWVKLTAYDIHNCLQPRRASQAGSLFVENGKTWPHHQTLLLFYLNHPIQFVQLVGVVVTYEDYFEKFWLFTVDDSSGATIEINCRKPEQPVNKVGADVEHNDGTKQETEVRDNIVKKLDIGSVVQVKGQIVTFRNIRQIQLERILVVRDTNHEVRLIAARSDFYKKILSVPWELSSAKQTHLHKCALGEDEDQKDRNRKRLKHEKAQKERELRHAERIARQYEREEHRRRNGADVARECGRMLRNRKQKHLN